MLVGTVFIDQLILCLKEIGCANLAITDDRHFLDCKCWFMHFMEIKDSPIK